MHDSTGGNPNIVYNAQAGNSVNTIQGKHIQSIGIEKVAQNEEDTDPQKNFERSVRLREVLLNLQNVFHISLKKNVFTMHHCVYPLFLLGTNAQTL